MRRWRDDRGSAVAEFSLVSVLLVLVALSVIQIALAMHVRTTLLDAAAEGARFGALADRVPADGVARTRELITQAIGPDYAADVSVAGGSWNGFPVVAITVRAPLPVVGLLGVGDGIEVTGHAVREILD